MRSITKGAEPTSLVEYRAQQSQYYEGVYDDFPHKRELRESLLQEQGYLCCYCMQRIAAPESNCMKIEHHKPRRGQNAHLDLALSYSNMMAACKGGEGRGKKDQICDTRKGDKLITINPLAEGQCERLIHYASGKIYSADSNIDDDLDKRLNLNQARLIENRKRTIIRARQLFEKRCSGRWTANQISVEIEKWRSRSKDGKHREYCQVAIYYLEKKLRKIQS